MDISREQIRMRRVLKNVRENRAMRSIYFNDTDCSSAKPGQFVMVWEPDKDEFPMSLSNYDAKGNCSVTVKPWGPGSNELMRAKRGDLIGIRGPYGRPFTVDSCNALLVGGGTGLALMLPLAKALVKVGSRVAVVIGGRSKRDLLFDKQLKRLIGRRNLFVTTDDGSYGYKGFPTDIAEGIVRERRVTRLYTCGPEVMMRRLFDIATAVGIEFEASLERSMKCGIGICGSCTVGSFLLCRDGPVLNGKELKETLGEFGRLQRDATGAYIKI